jgi:hypothetical protein
VGRECTLAKDVAPRCVGGGDPVKISQGYNGARERHAPFPAPHDADDGGLCCLEQEEELYPGTLRESGPTHLVYSASRCPTRARTC